MPAGTQREQLAAFATFLQTHTHLIEFGLRDFLPFVRNAASGLVAEAADARLAALKSRTWIARDPRPAAPTAFPLEARTFAGGKRAAAISADGKIAATASKEVLRIWRVEDGMQLHELAGHTREITDLALSPDGATGVSVARDATLRAWDFIAGACTQSVSVSGGYEGGYAEQVVLSADGRVVVTVNRYQVSVWDISTGTPRDLPRRAGHDPTSVALASDGRLALLAEHDCGQPPSSSIVSLWDLRSLTLLGKLVEGPGVSAVSMSADGRLGLTADWQARTLRVWDLRTGTCVRVLAGHSAAVTTGALTADGSMAVSGGLDGLRVWDVASGRCLREIEIDGGVLRVSITERAGFAVTVAFPRSARTPATPLWDLARGVGQAPAERHTCPVARLVWSPDGRRVASYAPPVILKGYQHPLIDDHAIRIWDAPSGACLERSSAPAEPIDLAFRSDGELTTSPARLNNPATPLSRTRDGRFVVRRAATATYPDPTLVLEDLTAGRIAATYVAGARVTAVSEILPDGRFVCGTGDGDVHFLHLVNGDASCPESLE